MAVLSAVLGACSNMFGGGRDGTMEYPGSGAGPGATAIYVVRDKDTIESISQRYGVPVHETGVGFKFVAPKVMETNAIIGGEESGGYAFRGHVPERDGILGNLLFLDFMVKTGKKPSELLALLFETVGAHYYDRVDTLFPTEKRDEVRRRVAAARPGIELGGLRWPTSTRWTASSSSSSRAAGC